MYIIQFNLYCNNTIIITHIIIVACKTRDSNYYDISTIFFSTIIGSKTD